MTNENADNDFSDVEEMLCQLESLNIRFAMIVSSVAFDDLEITVCSADDNPHSTRLVLDYEDAERGEALGRLQEIIGGIPIGYDQPEEWVDIANSEFSLNIPQGNPVDDDLAFRIGRAIKRRLAKSGSKPTLVQKNTPRTRPKEDRDREFYEMSHRGLKDSEIASNWNKRHLNDPVEASAVRKAISRYRKRLGHDKRIS